MPFKSLTLSIGSNGTIETRVEEVAKYSISVGSRPARSEDGIGAISGRWLGGWDLGGREKHGGK